MDSYYNQIEVIKEVTIPLKFEVADFIVIRSLLKSLIINILPTATNQQLMHRSVLTQLLLSINKKLNGQTSHKKLITIKIDLPKKYALQYLILDLGTPPISEYRQILLQNIINQLHQFDTNLPTILK